jgi:hypothetical protein
MMMSKRFLSSALVGLAASLSLVTAVRAATTLSFDDINFAPNSYESHQNHFFYGGLDFADEQMVVMPPGLGAYPLGASTQFLEFGSQPDVGDLMVISRIDGGAFDFLSIVMGLGDGNTTSGVDYVTVTGHKAADCQVNCADPGPMVLSVGYSFAPYQLTGFSGLSSITFSQQKTMINGQPVLDIGWLAIDDVSFQNSVAAGGVVPEPATWAMMIVGFGGVGALARRRGRRTALAAAA